MLKTINTIDNLDMPSITLTKVSDKSIYRVDDVVTIRIEIKNNGDIGIENVSLTDTFSIEAVFVESSLTLDGVSISGDTFVNNGLNIEDMQNGDSHIVTYQMIINKRPTQGIIINSSSLHFDYVDSLGKNQNGVVNSMTNSFTVLQSGNPFMELIKSPHQDIYKVGNTLTFTIVVRNTGDTDVNNVKLTDTIPDEANFLTSSLALNGKNIPGMYFVSNGLGLGTMVSGDFHIITYKMTINEMINSNSVMINPVIKYTYVDYNGQNQTGSLIGTSVPFTTIQNSPCCCRCRS